MEETNIPKVYDPQSFEKKWYQYWEENKLFHAEVDETKKPFSIVMPPPNVTGQLHMGHAMDNTLQDILIRFRRMQGYNTLWMPGTDHAGIATQAKVDAQLREQGVSRYDIGREKFLEHAWAWKEKYGNRIKYQIRTLGSSCDWDRERFTMDEGCSHAVREVFVQLYKKGLIYQGKRITNWCPHCNTALSDIEVEHQNEQGHLYHLKYQVEGEDRFVEIATPCLQTSAWKPRWRRTGCDSLRACGWPRWNSIPGSQKYLYARSARRSAGPLRPSQCGHRRLLPDGASPRDGRRGRRSDPYGLQCGQDTAAQPQRQKSLCSEALPPVRRQSSA